MKKKIIIIGSGLGGLAAAVRLAARGHEVDIFEKRDRPGGRAYVYEINGFRFDGGPSAITAPFLLEDLFLAAGHKREEAFELVRVEPYLRIFDGQGGQLDLTGDLDRMLSQIEARSPGDKNGYLKFRKASQAAFENVYLELTDRPFLHLIDLIKQGPRLVPQRAFQSVSQRVGQLVKDDFFRRALSVDALAVGTNPFEANSIYLYRHYLKQEWGVWHVRGGTGEMVSALEQLVKNLGGQIHLNSEVSEILAQNRHVTGVRLADGSVQRADLVVSNADPAWTYARLIPERQRRVYGDRKIKQWRYSNSLFVLYFGTRRRYNDCGLLHHNLILPDGFAEHMDEIFNKKVMAKDFLFWLHVPTLTDPSLAPEGCEAFVALVPTPDLEADIDWNQQARPFRDAILKYLEENYLPELRANIVAEHHIDPLHFQNTLNSYRGAGFSLQAVLRQSAWFRPHNLSEEFDNLYFTGAGTHPGAGVAGVLSSAAIVDDLIAGE